MRFLAPLSALVLVYLGACKTDVHQPGADQRACSGQSDCQNDEACVRSLCVSARAILCDVGNACPNNFNCCAGHCAVGACCAADSECPGGYCKYAACTEGARPACAQNSPCVGGKCLNGVCFECLRDEDCNSSNLVCSGEHSCVAPGPGCTPQSCSALGKICEPQEGKCRNCQSNAECGDLVCDGGSCAACGAGVFCGSGQSCQGGHCVADVATPCKRNADCGDRSCQLVSGRYQCADCLSGSECGANYSCGGGRCQGNPSDCQNDADCGPPDHICRAGRCDTGCQNIGCVEGQECNPTSGRCVATSTGNLALGSTCTQHINCLSNVCWPLDDNGQTVRFCSRTCTRHDDCPDDFVCYETGEANLCLPKNKVPVTGTFSVAPGDTCTSNAFFDYSCATGYCNALIDACYQTCGNDADCARDPSSGSACLARAFDSSTDISFTLLCSSADTSKAADGAVCVSGPSVISRQVDHDLCQSGFCAQTPNYDEAGRCASTCCTPQDCGTDNSICKPVNFDGGILDSFTSSQFGFAKTCLWREYTGTKNAGESCANDGECKSEICVAGTPGGVKRCTHTCCTNSDCSSYGWALGCRPPFLGTDAVSDPHAEQIVRSLGRRAQIYNQTSATPAIGISALCMPK